MSKVTKWRIIIVIIAFIQVISVQCIEHYNSPYQFGLHTSADDASYYAPGINWIKTGIWRDNSIGNSSLDLLMAVFSTITFNGESSSFSK